MIKSALLDVDGTLLLSNDAHAQAWVDAFAEDGRRLEFERVRQMIGMGGDKLLDTLVPGVNDKDGKGKELSERRKHIFSEKYASTLQAAPESRELLMRMREKGLELVIASSAKGEELKMLLTAAGVEDLIEEAATSSDVEGSKPDPDIVQEALKRVAGEASEVLMLGDTPYDIKAARQAGVGSVAVRCGGWGDDQLAGALAIYDDPADILAHYDTSPFASA